MGLNYFYILFYFPFFSPLSDASNHPKVEKKARLTRDQRKEVALNLAACGVSNFQNEQILSGSTNGKE